MPRSTVTIEGLADVERALRTIAPQIKGNPLRNAARAMAKVVEDDAVQNAVEDTGTLKKSITKKLIPLSERDAATGKGDSFEGFDVGVDKKKGAWYWWFVEAGTDKQPAQPFLRPALFSNKDRLPGLFAQKLKKSLELAAKRLAKNR